MRFLEYLEEEYAGLIGRSDIPYFVNPTRSDMKEMIHPPRTLQADYPNSKPFKVASHNPHKIVRFIINPKTKKIFMWDAFYADHDMMIRQLYSKLGPFDQIEGEGAIQPSFKVKCNDGFSMINKKWAIKNKKWLSQYVDFDRFVERTRWVNEHLSEEYLGSIKSSLTVRTGLLKGNPVFSTAIESPAYNFPSTKELSEFKHGVRFIIDIDKEKFYVWDGWECKVFHNEFIKKFKISKHRISGLGFVRGGKIRMNRKVGDQMWAKDSIKKKLPKLVVSPFFKSILRYFGDIDTATFLSLIDRE